MRLSVAQSGRAFGEFRFSQYPVTIGRNPESMVFLPDRAVSKKHAMLTKNAEGKWIIEDLDSVNKTFVNKKPVKKAELKTGDIISISDFELTVYIVNREAQRQKSELTMEDTLAAHAVEVRCVERTLDQQNPPSISFAGQRAANFLVAVESITAAHDIDTMCAKLIEIMEKQFEPRRVWCALRADSHGQMISHSGKTDDSKPITLTDIRLKDRVMEAVEEEKFMLLACTPSSSQKGGGETNSALVAPLISGIGCLGVIYLDNSAGDTPYSVGDLDYLMFLTMHAAAILRKIPPIPMP